MPDRPACESDPKYRDLKAGHWEHKGDMGWRVEPVRSAIVVPYQDPATIRRQTSGRPAHGALVSDRERSPRLARNANVRFRLSQVLSTLFR